VMRWNEIARAEVEGFDAALTTVLTSLVIVIVVAAIAGGKGGGGSGGGGGHGGGGGGGGGGGHGGGGGGGGGHVGANPSVASHGGGGGGGVHGGAVVTSGGGWGGNVVVVPNVGPNVTVGGGGPVEAVEPPPPPGAPSPLFSANARRRSTIALSVGIDGGTCVYGPTNCSTGAVRAGIRLADYVELTGGVRAMWGWGLADGVARWAPMGGVGLHGSFPRFRMLAFYFGLEAGGSESLPFVFGMRPGLRISPTPELSIGLFPVSPTFVMDNGPGRPSGWQFPTSLEVSTAF